jgi:hypothetical protein
LGFFQLSTEKSQQIETNGWLWVRAFQKPKLLIGRNHEAPFDVLPAASALPANRFLDLPISFLHIYDVLPPLSQILAHIQSFSSPSGNVSQTRAPAGAATTLAGFPRRPPLTRRLWPIPSFRVDFRLSCSQIDRVAHLRLIPVHQAAVLSCSALWLKSTIRPLLDRAWPLLDRTWPGHVRLCKSIGILNYGSVISEFVLCCLCNSLIR